ncbi:MAG TPA: hypothetical protein DCE81_06830 [Cytophagales bacterium]|nr:hypothetical protein [Cytophagales bacterium]
MRTILLLIVIGVTVASVCAQDTLSLPGRRNTIKVEFTSFALYRQPIVLSYERVVKRNQSMVFTAGLQKFPAVLNLGQGIFVSRDISASGHKLGFEYRFYLKKENKFAAPRGVYIGPYISYLGFSNQRDLTVDVNGTPESATLKTRFSIINPGVQLGYQFVLNNRWAIDLIFIGPSVSNYRGKMTLEGNFTFDPENVQNEILQNMIDRFPALEDLLTDGTVDREGTINTWSYGFRYQIQVGYHFGRKR